MSVTNEARYALKGRHLTGISDLSSGELRLVLAEAARIKRTPSHHDLHSRRTLALIFEKPSLRTRVTFEVGMTQLGGSAVYLAPGDIALGKRESIKDVASNLSRWVDGIAARVFSHTTVMELAEHSSVPVINALSDLEHPCQALADLQTVCERMCGDHIEPDFTGLKLAFVGDGNNVANSLLLASAKVGMDMWVACPPGYEPDSVITQNAKQIASEKGSNIEITSDVNEAVLQADVVYTDIWTSMGQEDQAEARQKAFKGFQVNSQLLAKAKPDAIVLHCLPAHREEEITSEVLDGAQSAVLDQAENRLHAQKALLALML